MLGVRTVHENQPGVRGSGCGEGRQRIGSPFPASELLFDQRLQICELYVAGDDQCGLVRGIMLPEVHQIVAGRALDRFGGTDIGVPVRVLGAIERGGVDTRGYRKRLVFLLNQRGEALRAHTVDLLLREARVESQIRKQFEPIWETARQRHKRYA